MACLPIFYDFWVLSYRDWDGCRAPNLKVVDSNPDPATTTWAIHDPVNVAGAKDLLGGRSERIFYAHYNLESGIEASRAMATS